MRIVPQKLVLSHRSGVFGQMTVLGPACAKSVRSHTDSAWGVGGGGGGGRIPLGGEPPRTGIIYTLVRKFRYRNPFRAKVYILSIYQELQILFENLEC